MRATPEQTLRSYQEYILARRKRLAQPKKPDLGPPPPKPKEPERRPNHPHQTHIHRPW